MSLNMPTLSVNTFFLMLIECIIFFSQWLMIPQATNINIIITHTLIALIFSYWWSRKWEKVIFKRNLSWFMLFAFIFFIPIIGATILWLFAIRKTLRRQHIKTSIGEEETNKNNDLYYFSAPKQHHSNASKQTRDLISTLDDDTYLKLLVASRHLPDKEAYTLLKEALDSPFESARLMAFALKGTLEERLQNELQQKLTKLRNTAKGDSIAELHLTIAKDYIHLLDIGLLSENNDTLLTKAKNHCMNAIRIDNKSAYAFQALSKILKRQGRNKQAQRAQIRAVDLGLPLQRLYAN